MYKFKNMLILFLVLSCGMGLGATFFPEGIFDGTQWVMYTTQSNLLVFIVYGSLIVKKYYCQLINKSNSNQGFNETFMGAVMLAIVITGIVYNFVLAPSGGDYTPNSLSSVLLHTVTPILVFIDWFFFSDKQKLNKFSPLKWSIIPLVYWVFTMCRAKIGQPINMGGEKSNYPYFFIDIDKYGFSNVFINVCIMFVVFVGFGYIMLLASKAYEKVILK